MTRFVKLTLLLALVAMCAGSAIAEMWNLASDYSQTSTTFHNWTVGYKNLTTQTLTPYNTWYWVTVDQAGWWWLNDGWAGGCVLKNFMDIPQVIVDPYQVALHTGNNANYLPAVRWTSPSDQMIHVDAFFSGQSAEPTTVTTLVYRNNVTKFSAPINGYYGVWPDRAGAFGDPQSQAFNGYIWAPAGTTIDFAISPIGKWSGNVTQLNATLETATNYAVFVGTVRSAATGLVIAGATVQAVNGSTTYTDVAQSDGTYMMAVPANASFTMTASATGYESQTMSAASGAQNSLTTQDFSLPSRTITGFVLQAGGAPVANAKVEIIGGLSTLTNADGSYLLNASPGVYDVKATHGGYTADQASIDVTTGSATHTFNLTRLTSFDYVADFSTTENPNGVWTYGYHETSGNTFGRYPSTYTYTEYSNLMFWDWDQSLSYGSCWYYPGSETLVLGVQSWLPGTCSMLGGYYANYSADGRFTVPYNGTFVVDAQFVSHDNTTADVNVRKNMVTLATGIIDGNAGWAPDYEAKYGNPEWNYSRVLSVVEGDTIDFTVGVGTNGFYGNDLVAVEATLHPIDPTKAAIVGVVSANNTGNPPVAGAAILVDEVGAQMVSDGDGGYGIALDPGTYTFIVSKANFEQQTKTITVAAGDTATLNFALDYLPGQTYHVKPDGNDANDGLTFETAWATIDNGDKTAVLTPGSTVQVHAGTYGYWPHEGTIASAVLKKCPGKPGSPITYQAVGKVVLNGFDWRSACGFRVDSPLMHDIVIDGFEIIEIPFPICLIAGDNNVVKNCNVHDYFGALDIFPSCAGVWVQSNNNLVENCTFGNIRLNVFSGGASTFLNGCAIFNDGGSGNTYRKNACFNLAGDDGRLAMVMSGSNVKFQNNTFEAGTTGLKVSGDSSQVQFINNAVTNMLGAGLVNEDPVGTVTNTYNLYYNNAGGDFSGNVSAGTGEKFGQDPMYINPPFHNVRLRAGSPAINAGTNIGLPYVGSAPDMGAYEYDGVGLVPVSDLGTLGSLADFAGIQLTQPKVATADSGSINFMDGTLQTSYIEEPTRYAGIKVIFAPDQYVYQNQTVTLTGDLATDSNGDRMIRVAEITAVGSETLAPLGVSAKTLFEPGSDPTGVVVRTWGKVTFVNAIDSLNPLIVYVDDGSGKTDGLGIATGTRVLFPFDLGIICAGFEVGDYVSVAGIASHENVNGVIVPVIRMRHDDDGCEYSAL